MAITKSYVKSGSLTFTVDLVDHDFSCQPTNVTIATSYDETGDAVEVLCGDEEAADVAATRTMNITAIQDFTDPDGFQKFLWDNETQTVAFTWMPNGTTGPTFTGNVQCQIGDIGGDVGAMITSDLELPATNVVWTPAA